MLKEIKTYHDNGKLCTKFYVDNKAHRSGLFQRYYQEGGLYCEVFFINNKAYSIERSSSKYGLNYLSTYKNSLYNGIRICFKLC